MISEKERKMLSAMIHMQIKRAHEIMTSNKVNSVFRSASENPYSLVSIIIPVVGRKEHLKQSLKCLTEQRAALYEKIPQLTGSVNIVVSEHSSSPEHDKLCSSVGISYVHIQSDGTFNKSYAMNVAASLNPGQALIFYDVDMLTEKDWLTICIETLTSIKEKCWICQPIPSRKIRYLSEENTVRIFGGYESFDEIKPEECFTQPSWHKGNFPPGGIIMVSSALFYAVSGYDFSLFWDYSPEDRAFMENCVRYSNKLITWSESSHLKNKVYHMHHAEPENKNSSYEHMVFAEKMLSLIPLFRTFYFANKPSTKIFQRWSSIDKNSFPSIDLNHIGYSLFRDNQDLSMLTKIVEDKFPNLKNDNPAMYRMIEEYVGDISGNENEYFSLFQGAN